MEKPISELLEFSVINIDKPSGPTSFSVSDFVRKELGLKKTSHFGTLDPKVTGVLPIALGRGCKLTGFFLGHDKEYVGIMHVHKEISIEKLQEIINKNFLGKIMQKPPIKSKVKRVEREREIISFEILEQNSKDFLFKTKVQGGTYIRKLIDDLGKETGGAHMLELRRIQAGIFNEKDSHTLYELKEAVDEFKKGKQDKLKKMLVPGENAIKEIMPVIQIKEKAVRPLLTGKPLFKEDLAEKIQKFKEDDLIAVFFKEKFIEIAKISEKDSIFARPEFVFN
ncbi:MAG: RNA-guided pseudouridylation complex pseudouridine synthase subunit Cbf5 [Nanoarchaeota archaeon]|nr:RNA-guided pseudouridylation complex pseudouridine synthase subunit Cbf5 [Nanoarchaeota archaeon]